MSDCIDLVDDEQIQSLSGGESLFVDDAQAVSEGVGPSSERTSSRSGRTVKKRKKSSWVFDHFAIGDNGSRICTVAKCKTVYSNSTSTSTLSLHLKVKHKI